jgi:ABC-type dipeptide/oligopeptide/nickel transport system permease subunit
MSNLESIAAAETPAANPAPTAPTGGAKADKPRSLAGDAWRDLRRNPIFWVAATLVLLFVVMAIVPQLFTPADPASCALSRQYAPASGRAWFGYDFQGCDLFARTIYGARASIQVGVFAMLMAGTIALVVGLSSGYFGGWVDTLLSRFTDIVLGIPLLLAAIVLGKRLAGDRQGTGIWTVVIVLGVLGWTTASRVMRSSVISAKNQDYVAAARMLGAGHGRIMFRHILPNALAPFVVVMTIALGGFIAVEATLSFLGIGLKAPAISWGIDISSSTVRVRENAIPLVAPSTFLALTVLAFIMLGDAIRDAFDPKLR